MDDVSADEVRRACSDAERRAARAFARELRRRERRPRVETVWVRPAWAWTWLVLALIGVGASVAMPDAPEVALAVLVLVSMAALVELDGRLPAASWPWPRRATQNVWAPVPGGGSAAGRTRVVLAAAYDTPRRADGLLARLGAASPGLVVTGLVALLACAGARVAGAEGTVLGAAQLVPTLALLVAAAALLQQALGRHVPGVPDAAELALDAVAELDRRPPRRLDLELLLCGAGDARAAGLRARVRDGDAALVWVERGDGPATAWRRTGPLRFHPDLVAAADEAGFTPASGPPPHAAAFARRTRRPAIALTAATADDVVRLVRALDARLRT